MVPETASKPFVGLRRSGIAWPDDYTEHSILFIRNAAKMIVRDALTAMRPAQWVKNAFVLVGPLFGHRWAGDDLRRAGLAFVVFCLASSAVYLYNDWVDREADRRHPAKQDRPIAAGRIGGLTVGVLILLALCAAYAGALFIGGPMAFLVSAYLGLNVAYTLLLKHVVIDRGRVAMEKSKSEIGSAQELIEYMEAVAKPEQAILEEMV